MERITLTCEPEDVNVTDTQIWHTALICNEENTLILEYNIDELWKISGVERERDGDLIMAESNTTIDYIRSKVVKLDYHSNDITPITDDYPSLIKPDIHGCTKIASLGKYPSLTELIMYDC